jgi:hypothetical protein
VAAVALFAGFGLRSKALSPDETFASLSVGELVPNRTRAAYLQLIGRSVGPGDDARIGNVIPLKLATNYRGTVEFRSQTVDLENTSRVESHPRVASRLAREDVGAHLGRAPSG